MNRCQRIIVLTLALLTLPVAVLAQGTPVAANSTATLVCADPAVSIYVLPDGSGIPLSQSYGSITSPITATIVVTLFDASGLPVPGVYNREIRLEYQNSNMSWCSDSFYPPPPHAANCADSDTNVAGQTTFTLAYHGGGAQFQSCRVWVLEANGLYMPIPQTLAVSMNSPDITGDLVVNLSDIVAFAGDLQGGVAPYRSDFAWDGVINLTDMVIFSQALGVTCP